LGEQRLAAPRCNHLAEQHLPAIPSSVPTVLFGNTRASQTIGDTVFIAMNRFKVVPGSQAEFEQVWTTRDTHLRDVPGFLTFHLLRGPDREDHTLYSSHSIWCSRADFEAWTRSEAFRRAHNTAGSNKPLYLGHPEFEGFEVLQTVAGTAAAR
jgi:heme-degrading monooxygenase HmoA